MIRIAGMVLGAVMSLSLVAPVVHADAAAGDIRLAAQEPFMSLDQAVAKVRRMVDGDVISAKTRYHDGKPVHYIKVYDNGRVRTFRVDASTGRIK